MDCDKSYMAFHLYSIFVVQKKYIMLHIKYNKYLIKKKTFLVLNIIYIINVHIY